MKDRPILFQGAMVRALLDGSKTQTRRIFKAKNGGVWPNSNDLPGMKQIMRNSPYGQPSDRLWVRETWCREFEGGFNYRADDAPGEKANFVNAEGEPVKGSRWKPSIHMPRAASRITLEITGVRLERLWHISEQDSIAEGLEAIDRDKGYWRDYEAGYSKAFFKRSAWASYRTLWISINGIESWDANPWVWVVEFKRVDGGAA